MSAETGSEIKMSLDDICTKMQKQLDDEERGGIIISREEAQLIIDGRKRIKLLKEKLDEMRLETLRGMPQ